MNTPTKHPPEFESPELESTAVVSLDSAANASPNPTSTTQAAPDSGSRQIPVWREIPNVAVGLVILSGVLVEGWMLGRVAQPVYSLGISVGLLTGTFLIWFWSTVGLLLHAVARRSLRNEANRPAVTTWAARLGYGLAIAFVTLTYAVSWGLFFQTGRFANLEVAQFMFANTHDLWLYLAQAEPVHLARMAGVVLVVAVATPFFLPWLARTDQPDRSPAIWRNRWWVWSSIACVAAALLVVRDPSYGRRCERFGHLEHSLNPLVTFAVSARQAFFAEPISPVLDESQLRPLATPFPVPPQVKRPSIIIVAIESLRQDVVHLEHQGREITPHINRLARDGLTWNNAYAQSTHSDYADVCIVSSLYPLRTRHHLYYSRNDPWPKTLIYDVLKSAGYETAIISSQNEAWGAMDQFLESPHLDHFYHPQRSTKTHLQVRPTRDPGFNYELETGYMKIGKFPDRHTATQAIAWIRERAQADEPFFLSMNLQSSHFPYAIPDDAPRPFQPCELDDDIMFMMYPPEKTPAVRNAYFNGVHEADQQVGRLIDTLRELKLDDDVIVLVVGENGEAFHENNTVGHAREPYEPAIHVATIMWGPSYFEPGVDEYPLEHVDLIPTVLGRLGWPMHPNFQGTDLLSSARPPLNDRWLFFHVNSPSARADAVQYAGRWKYMWSYDRRQGWLFDLEADPTESQDCSDDHPELAQRLWTRLQQWRAAQLAYYHYPQYYGHYYPPKSQVTEGVEVVQQ